VKRRYYRWIEMGVFYVRLTSTPFGERDQWIGESGYYYDPRLLLRSPLLG
jgi:hypothetical protein